MSILHEYYHYCKPTYIEGRAIFFYKMMDKDNMMKKLKKYLDYWNQRQRVGDRGASNHVMRCYEIMEELITKQ